MQHPKETHRTSSMPRPESHPFPLLGGYRGYGRYPLTSLLRARTFLTLQATCGRGRQVSSNWQEECTARLHWHAQTGPIDYPEKTRGRGGSPFRSIDESKLTLNCIPSLCVVRQGLWLEAPIRFFCVASQLLWIEILVRWGREKIEVSIHITGRRAVCGRNGCQ